MSKFSKILLFCVPISLTFLNLFPYFALNVVTTNTTPNSSLNNSSKWKNSVKNSETNEYKISNPFALSARKYILSSSPENNLILARLQSPVFTNDNKTYPINNDGYNDLGTQLNFINTPKNAVGDKIYLNYTSGTTPVGSNAVDEINMLDFNNDSLISTNLSIPAFYLEGDSSKNNIGKITKVTITDGRENNITFHPVEGEVKEYYSPLTEIGYFCFSSQARIFNNTNPLVHSYYHDSKHVTDNAPAFSSLEEVEFKDLNVKKSSESTENDLKALMGIKVIHAGAFANANKLKKVDFGPSNRVTYIDEFNSPSFAQVQDYKNFPNITPKPFYQSDGADYSERLGIFENDSLLTNVELHQQHSGQYSDATKTYHSYLKSIPARMFKNAINLSSFNSNGVSGTNSFFIPNSVAYIGSEAFANAGTSTKYSKKIYFPEPDISKGETGILECANDIFGETVDMLDEIFLPDPNPSSNFLVGLTNSLSKMPLPGSKPGYEGKVLKIHVPYNYKEKPEEKPSYTASDSIYAKYILSGTRRTDIQFDFITPASVSLVKPKNITSIYAKTSSSSEFKNFNDFDGDWTKGKYDDYAWKITTLPHHAAFTEDDFNLISVTCDNNKVVINPDNSSVKKDKYIASDGSFYLCPSYKLTQDIPEGISKINLTFSSPSSSVHKITNLIQEIKVWSEASVQSFKYGKDSSWSDTSSNFHIVKKISESTNFANNLDEVKITPLLASGNELSSELIHKNFSLIPNISFPSKISEEPFVEQTSNLITTYNYSLFQIVITYDTANKCYIGKIIIKNSQNTSLCGSYSISFELHNNINGRVLKTSSSFKLDFWFRTSLVSNPSINHYFNPFINEAESFSLPDTTYSGNYHFVYANDFCPITSSITGSVFPSNKVDITYSTVSNDVMRTASTSLTLKDTPQSTSENGSFSCILTGSIIKNDIPTNEGENEKKFSFTITLKDNQDSNISSFTTCNLFVKGYTDNWLIERGSETNDSLGIFDTTTYIDSSASFPIGLLNNLPALVDTSYIGKLTFKLSATTPSEGAWSIVSKNSIISQENILKYFAISPVSKEGSTPLKTIVYVKNNWKDITIPGSFLFSLVFTPVSGNAHSINFTLNTFKMTQPTISIIDQPTSSNPKNIYFDSAKTKTSDLIDLMNFNLTPNFLYSITPNLSYDLTPNFNFNDVLWNSETLKCEKDETTYKLKLTFEKLQNFSTNFPSDFSFLISSFTYSDSNFKDTKKIEIPINNVSIPVNNVNIIKKSSKPTELTTTGSSFAFISLGDTGSFEKPFLINSDWASNSQFANPLNSSYDKNFSYHYSILGLRKKKVDGSYELVEEKKDKLFKISQDGIVYWNGEDFSSAAGLSDEGEYSFDIGFYIDVKNSNYSNDNAKESLAVLHASTDDSSYSFSNQTWSNKEGNNLTSKKGKCNIVVSSSDKKFTSNIKDPTNRGDYIFDNSSNLYLVFSPLDKRTIKYEVSIPHAANNYFGNDTQYECEITNSNHDISKIVTAKLSELTKPTEMQNGKAVFDISFFVPSLPTFSDFSFSLNTFVTHEGNRILALSSFIFNCYISKITGITAHYYQYGANNTKKEIKNGSTIDFTIKDNIIDEYIFVEYSFKTDYTPIEKNTNEAVWLLWFNRLERSSSNVISLNSKQISSSNPLPLWLKVEVEQYDIHNGGILNAEKFGQPFHLHAEAISKHPNEYSNFWGKYTLNTSVKFSKEDWYGGASDFNYNFGIYFNIHPVVVDHTSSTIIIIVVIVVVLIIGIILIKVFVTKAKARKLMKEEENEERERSGSSSSFKFEIKSNFGKEKMEKESSTGF